MKKLWRNRPILIALLAAALFLVLAALTVGCIFQGILEIYGTTNKMIAVYPVAAAVLLCFGFAAYLIPLLTLKRLRRYI